MDWQLVARATLRIVAFLAAYMGWATEDQTSFIYQNADVVTLVALMMSETWFTAKKTKERWFS